MPLPRRWRRRSTTGDRSTGPRSAPIRAASTGPPSWCRTRGAPSATPPDLLQLDLAGSGALPFGFPTAEPTALPAADVRLHGLYRPEPVPALDRLPHLAPAHRTESGRSRARPSSDRPSSRRSHLRRRHDRGRRRPRRHELGPPRDGVSADRPARRRPGELALPGRRGARCPRVRGPSAPGARPPESSPLARAGPTLGAVPTTTGPGPATPGSSGPGGKEERLDRQPETVPDRPTPGGAG